MHYLFTVTMIFKCSIYIHWLNIRFKLISINVIQSYIIYNPRAAFTSIFLNSLHILILHKWHHHSTSDIVVLSKTEQHVTYRYNIYITIFKLLFTKTSFLVLSNNNNTCSNVINGETMNHVFTILVLDMFPMFGLTRILLRSPFLASHSIFPYFSIFSPCLG